METNQVKLKSLQINSFTGQHDRISNMMIADFLFHHLDQYGDKFEDIMKAIDYVFQKNQGKGGFILVEYDEQLNEIMGAVVVNETGMEGYIPENILVYIAVNSKMRGKGLGKKMMQDALRMAKGNVALHVEPDNPARKLYENLGFTNKYLEMRFEK